MSCPPVLGSCFRQAPAQTPAQFPCSVPFPQAPLCSNACRDLAAGTAVLLVFGSLSVPRRCLFPVLWLRVARERRAFCPLLMLRRWHMKPQSLNAARWKRNWDPGVTRPSLRGLPHASLFHCAILRATVTVHKLMSTQQLPRNHPGPSLHQRAAGAVLGAGWLLAAHPCVLGMAELHGRKVLPANLRSRGLAPLTLSQRL